MLFLVDHFGDITIEVVLFLLGFRWFAAPHDRGRTEKLFLTSLAALLASAISLHTMRWLGRVMPYRYDLYLCRLGEMVGLPSFALGRLLDEHVPLKALALAAYNNLPAVMLITIMTNLYWNGRRMGREAFLAFVINPLLAMTIYVLIPVSGPIYTFGHQFPFAPGPFTLHTIRLSAPPNGVPSVHLSSALLVLWFMRRSTWGRIFGIGFLVLTIVATLGLGEHYLIDLLVALPYTAVVIELAEWIAERSLMPGLGSLGNITSNLATTQAEIKSAPDETEFQHCKKGGVVVAQ